MLADGRRFEKAGVNFSDVHGELRPEMARALPGEGATLPRHRHLAGACTRSSPRVPTVHANVRCHPARRHAAGSAAAPT